MADGSENKGAPVDDVKQSFAWGQLFAGSLIGGLAVWKLLHKMTNTEPSEWFRGLSLAYEEVRDFLMTPFEWIQLDLTTSEKNVVVVCLVLMSAIVRSLWKFRNLIIPFAVAFSATSGAVLAPLALFLTADPTGAIPPTVSIFDALDPISCTSFSECEQRFEQRNNIMIPLTILFLASVVTPLLGMVVSLFSSFRDTAPVHAMTLMNLTFTLLCGTFLLFLNWATS